MLYCFVTGLEQVTHVKDSKYGTFSGPDFPVFSPNTNHKRLRI